VNIIFARKKKKYLQGNLDQIKRMPLPCSGECD